MPGGILVVVEPWPADRLEDGIGNPVARIDWAASTSLCTPTALAQVSMTRSAGLAWTDAHDVLGNQGGPTGRLKLFAEAGFTGGWPAMDTGQNLILTAPSAG